MSTPTSIYFLAILFVGVPASLRVTGHKVRIRNWTALGIVLMFLFARAIWEMTGDWLPVGAMVLQDMFVIGCMFLKDDWCDCGPYRTLGYQLACGWHERTPCDRAILALFPLAWLFYFPVANPQLQYWTLYGIGFVQLALAGWEAFGPSRGRMAIMSRADDAKPPGLTFTAREWSHA